MDLLPTLQTGLDVNVRFDTPFSFELTPALLLFDLCGITLCHGWTVDPQDEETYRVVVGRLGSYNRVVEAVVGGEEAAGLVGGGAGKGKEREVEGEEKVNRETLIHEVSQTFLTTTASQLTYHGLTTLSDSLPPTSLSVLFRNNHFSTLLRSPTTTTTTTPTTPLHTLVTDQGFLNTPGVVWETLANVEGDSTFSDGLLGVFPGEREVDDAVTGVVDEETERAIALVAAADGGGDGEGGGVSVEEQRRAWEALTTTSRALTAGGGGGESFDDDLALAIALSKRDQGRMDEDGGGGGMRGGGRGGGALPTRSSSYAVAQVRTDAEYALQLQRVEEERAGSGQVGGRGRRGGGGEEKKKENCLVM
ncbi:Ubiquitin carboxyl-terminal hydrolase MINDY-1 [Dinochytrium kinnereticum]|nr:Ubiquitin carboxyl-terminal hydrolase MINDY-1 [Dinochytrium kinnereticum]